MRSIRHTVPSLSASVEAAPRESFVPKIRHGISAKEFLASLQDTPAKAAHNETHHLFAAMIVLLGLEMLAPLLLTQTGTIGSLATVIPSMPAVFTALAVIGGLVVLTGVALFAQELHRPRR